MNFPEFSFAILDFFFVYIYMEEENLMFQILITKNKKKNSHNNSWHYSLPVTDFTTKKKTKTLKYTQNKKKMC